MFIRSKLFVPGSRPELFEKAVNSEADAISFDLEDAVAADRKDQARASVVSFLRGYRPTPGKIAIVRVNAVATAWFARDVEAVVSAGPYAINLPKVDSAADVHVAVAAIARAEKVCGDGRNISILANIETPKGLRLAAEIAAADPRVIGLQLGLADLFLPLGIDRRDAAARRSVGLAVRLAAGEAHIPAYDAAFLDMRSSEVCREEAEGARRLGYAGKSCIHPSQIAIVNDVFAPRADEIEYAGKVLAAARDAAERGVQALVVDGHFIDAPVIGHARAVAEAAGRYGMARSGETRGWDAN